MRILQVCSAQSLGGGEVHVIQLVGELRRLGHQVEVVGRSGSPVGPDHELALRNALDLSSVLGLRRIVRRGRFDVVHAHLARDYPLAAAALWRFAGPRLILTRQLVLGVKPNPLYRRVDGWIATTGQIRDTLGHLRPRRIAVIPNWTDTANLPYRERPFHDPVVVGLLGQISPHKGHDDAIRTIRALGPGFRLVIGGEGRPEYVRSLRERSGDLPVEFLGFVNSRTFLEGIDVLILPSREEPFGIVVVEAMAAGINVVATARGGPPEILDHGKAGLLVPPRDPEAMAQAIRQLASNRELARSLTRRARERVLDRYDISGVVPRIVEFYENLA